MSANKVNRIHPSRELILRYLGNCNCDIPSPPNSFNPGYRPTAEITFGHPNLHRPHGSPSLASLLLWSPNPRRPIL